MHITTNIIAFVGIYFAGLNFIGVLNDWVSLIVLALSGLWLAVQSWAKIKLTKISISETEKGQDHGEK